MDWIGVNFRLKKCSFWIIQIQSLLNPAVPNFELISCFTFITYEFNLNFIRQNLFLDNKTPEQPKKNKVFNQLSLFLICFTPLFPNKSLRLTFPLLHEKLSKLYHQNFTNQLLTLKFTTHKNSQIDKKNSTQKEENFIEKLSSLGRFEFFTFSIRFNLDILYIFA